MPDKTTRYCLADCTWKYSRKSNTCCCSGVDENLLPGCGVYRKKVGEKFPNQEVLLLNLPIFWGNLALKMKKSFQTPDFVNNGVLAGKFISQSKNGCF